MPEFQQAQLDAYLSKVIDAIIRGDNAALGRFGRQDGFINNKIRRFVWWVDPKTVLILGLVYSTVQTMITRFTMLCYSSFPTWTREIRPRYNKTYEGPLLDFLVRLLSPLILMAGLDDVRRAELEEKLERTINRVLRIHPRLHYVQVTSLRSYFTEEGFHDIAEVLLLVNDNDEELSCKLLHRLSLINLRGTNWKCDAYRIDMLLPSLDSTLHSLDMIPAILQRVDKTLYRRVLKAVRPPHFAASAVMTWFSHELDDIDKVATLFDFLLSSPPIMIFYLAAAVLP
jgi:Rab-GTPase-TBC domain